MGNLPPRAAPLGGHPFGTRVKEAARGFDGRGVGLRSAVGRSGRKLARVTAQDRSRTCGPGYGPAPRIDYDDPVGGVCDVGLALRALTFAEAGMSASEPAVPASPSIA